MIPAEKQCALAGCERRRIKRQWCVMHEKRIRRRGEPGSALRMIKPKANNARTHALDAILAFIIAYKQKHDGTSPSLREIGAGCGISSTSVVSYNLALLDERGDIVLKGKGARRQIEVVGGRWTYQVPAQQAAQAEDKAHAA